MLFMVDFKSSDVDCSQHKQSTVYRVWVRGRARKIGKSQTDTEKPSEYSAENKTLFQNIIALLKSVAMAKV